MAYLKNLRFPGFKIKSLTLSYDDGGVSDYKLIEIMKKYGIKGTFNLNSGLFSDDESHNRTSKEKALKVYDNEYCEVAAHGLKHIFLTGVSDEVAVNEIVEDKRNLEKMFGKIVKGFAYAFGDYNDHIIQLLKNCGIKYARTTISSGNFKLPDNWLELAATCHHGDERLMKLLDEFLTETPKNCNYWCYEPQMFYVWGHCYEFDSEEKWKYIENFCKKAGGREDVWYATNGEICDYVEAFKRLEFSADGTICYNPTSVDIYYNYYGANFIIKSGETVKLDGAVLC